MKRFLASLLVLAAVLVAAPSPAHAKGFVPISGAGSTWSFNALDDWRRNVAQFGITVNFAASGSTDGRNQFREGKVDFAVSEIPYGMTDPGAGGDPPPPNRELAYMPIVAGGTAFMYNLKIGGQRVTNLRLSGENVTKIFTGVITSWDDPAIKEDNPQLALPKRDIIPVFRSDGSGTSAQFTLWMSKQHPQLWSSFCTKVGRPATCGMTSQYPKYGKAVGQGGSLGVAGYVSQNHAEGAITYVEYSYAINQNFPVAKVLNKSRYYVEPTADAVAVALTNAEINTDLTQKLDNVYNSPDERAYPLSSYSYMILPLRTGQGGLTEDKGYTLSEFSYYFLCEGQRQVGELGYSPLPINLVRAGLTQVARVPGAEQNKVTDISKCNNPTFSKEGVNTLVATAPKPPPCDAFGKTQCETGTGGLKKTKTVLTKPQGTVGGRAGGTGTTGGTGGSGAGTNPQATGTAGPGGTGAGGDGAVAGGSGDGSGGDAGAIPVALAADTGWRLRHTLMVLLGLLLVMVVVGPPLISKRLGRGGGEAG
ncbi:phosphate ABC transporter substrate-binding protein PstS [Longispora albida]|uniref:phosphate ABC transporter substrate-binding protein PstS n=1 Tax=Longispora albida TaxID=203523 RepID=UPI0003774B08|nr:phosphate ABC transporter substrate-binding protein PstS [Longispora albida]